MKGIKQVIVVRTDLNMRKGKLAAQVAHASMKVFFDRMMKDNSLVKMHPRWSGSWDGVDDAYICEFTEQMEKWMETSFTKIVGCNSEQELFELQKQAEEARIVNAIIQDSGLTEFKEECPKCFGEGIEIVQTDRWEEQYKCDSCKGTGKINKPTYTCLAIGPDYSDKIDNITRHLKLL